MQAAARQEHHVTRLYGNAMDTFRHRSVANRLLELVPTSSFFQADIEGRFGRRIGDVPHFSLRLAAQFFGHLLRWMHLDRKFLLRVEDFNQQRKTARRRFGVAKQFGAMLLHQPAQGLSAERTVVDFANGLGSVSNLPRFADRHAFRKLLLVKSLQVAPAPDSLLENRTKF